MPTLSALKNTVLSALKSPHEGSNPGPSRRVISFNEALGNLKSGKTAFAPCAAFSRFGRCRKGVSLRESDFVANLDELDMTDIQTPMKLMPLMLCSTHWGKTIYNNALFLDWLSIYGSKKDNQHFESIVVDYQSAIVLDNEQPSLLNHPVSGDSEAETPGRPASALSSPVKEECHINSPCFPDDSKISIDHAECEYPEAATDHLTNDVPEISILASLDSYASIELGAAKLEIMYQDNLKCIAMTSGGWRCQEIIQRDRLLHARRLLNNSVISDTELDTDLFSFLALCPGHAEGDLSRIYCDKWATFAEQRLPKEEAMVKFDAEFWMSVQFFRGDVMNVACSKKMRRPRSTSHLRWRRNLDSGFENDGNTEVDFLPPPPNITFSFRCLRPESASPTAGPDFTSAKLASDDKTFQDKVLFETKPTDQLSSEPIGFRSIAHMSQPPVLSHQRSNAKSTSALDTPIAKNCPTNDPDATSNSKPEYILTSASRLFSSLRITDLKSQSDNKPSTHPKEIIDEGISMDNSTRVHGLQSETITTAATSFKEHTLPSIPSRSLDDIHKNMIRKIDSPNLQGGIVYVSKSLDGTLIRIGTAPAMYSPDSTTQAHKCSLQALNRVGVELISVKHFPERVLSLVYLELENFKVQVACHQIAGGLEEDEHKQWFKVPEAVALRSVRLWCDFVDQAYTSEGIMAEDWAKAHVLIPPPSSYEFEFLKLGLKVGNESCLNIHHDLRHKRYEGWIRDWENVFVKHPEGAMTDGRPGK